MKKIISIIIIVSMLATDLGGRYPIYAQEAFLLPLPGRVGLTAQYNPPLLKGIKVNPENPFRLDFILDLGDETPSENEDYTQTEATRLIKYFLASVTTPEKDMWVNLSPYEKDRIVPESFGQTEMGRDMLAEDYLLKQITASLMVPDDETGQKFWERIRAEAMKKFGVTDLPIETFNKVWIVPEKAVVYENAETKTAYIVESRLKVMLESDYLALQKSETVNEKSTETNELGKQIIREIVIPELTKEVNTGKNFVKLRQVYNSLILATWYKKKIKDSILNEVYADQNKIAGVNIDDSNEKQKIYEEYLEAFKDGVYTTIKEEYDPVTQSVTPRQYFSGGIVWDMAMLETVSVISDAAMNASKHLQLTVDVTPQASLQLSDPTMIDFGPVKVSERIKRMPAWELLGVLDLDKAKTVTVSKGPEGLTIQRIQVLKLANKSKVPQGLEILPYELFNTTDFEVLYNKQGYLIAILPVLPKDFQIKDKERRPHYFDFSEFYFEVPKIDDPNAKQKWAALAKDIQQNRQAVGKYWNLTERSGEIDRIPRYTPYLYVNLDPRGNYPHIDAFYTEKFSLKVDSWKIGYPDPIIRHGILPVFPTVYHPGSHFYEDWEYILATVRHLDIKKQHDVLVVGPGNGLEAWFISRNTNKKIYAVGINPLEVANTRATAKVAGFEVEAKIHDNIISREGVPVFTKKFDRIIWNMPAYSEKALRERDELEEFHDGDYEGLALKRFAEGLPLLLKPDGFAMLWNSAHGKGLDKVKKILELDGRMKVEFQEVPGKAYISTMETGEKAPPTGIYFIRHNLNKSAQSSKSKAKGDLAMTGSDFSLHGYFETIRKLAKSIEKIALADEPMLREIEKEFGSLKDQRATAVKELAIALINIKRNPGTETESQRKFIDVASGLAGTRVPSMEEEGAIQMADKVLAHQSSEMSQDDARATIRRIFNRLKDVILMELSFFDPKTIDTTQLYPLIDRQNEWLAYQISAGLPDWMLVWRSDAPSGWRYKKSFATTQPIFTVVVNPNGIPSRIIIKTTDLTQDPRANASHETGNDLLKAINSPSVWVHTSKNNVFIGEIYGDNMSDFLDNNVSEFFPKFFNKFLYAVGFAMASAHILGMGDRFHNMTVNKRKLEMYDKQKFSDPSLTPIVHFDREGVLDREYLEKDPRKDVFEVKSSFYEVFGSHSSKVPEITQEHIDSYLEGFRNGYQSHQAYFQGHRETVTTEVERLAGGLSKNVLDRLRLSEEELDEVIAAIRSKLQVDFVRQLQAQPENKLDEPKTMTIAKDVDTVGPIASRELLENVRGYLEKNPLKVLKVNRNGLISLEGLDREAYLNEQKTRYSTEYLYQLLGYGMEAQGHYRTLFEIITKGSFVRDVLEKDLQDINYSEHFSDQEVIERIKKLVPDQGRFMALRKVLSNDQLMKELFNYVSMHKIEIQNLIIYADEEVVGVIQVGADHQLRINIINEAFDLKPLEKVLKEILPQWGWKMARALVPVEAGTNNAMVSQEAQGDSAQIDNPEVLLRLSPHAKGNIATWRLIYDYFLSNDPKKAKAAYQKLERKLGHLKIDSPEAIQQLRQKQAQRTQELYENFYREFGFKSLATNMRTRLLQQAGILQQGQSPSIEMLISTPERRIMRSVGDLIPQQEKVWPLELFWREYLVDHQHNPPIIILEIKSPINPNTGTRETSRFILDGHHRIAAARRHGVLQVEANVIVIENMDSDLAPDIPELPFWKMKEKTGIASINDLRIVFPERFTQNRQKVTRVKTWRLGDLPSPLLKGFNRPQRIDNESTFNSAMLSLDKDQGNLVDYILKRLGIDTAKDNSFNIDNSFEFAARLLQLPLSALEKKDVLTKLVEPFIFSRSAELRVDVINTIYQAYNTEDSFKYSLYYISTNSDVPLAVRNWAKDILSKGQKFSLHKEVVEKLKGKKNVLVAYSIEDGQGDELIEMGVFIQGLLDLNPELNVTILSDRRYLYDHPRVEVITVTDLENDDWKLKDLTGRYDMVINHRNNGEYSKTLEQALVKKGLIGQASIYIKTNPDNFTFPNVVINGKEYADSLGLNRARIDNVYEGVFRLAAELGLPIRTAAERAQKGSLFTGISYVNAETKWKEMMRQVGNELQDGEYTSPVVIFNPYGGMSAEKGFIDTEADQQELIQTIKSVVEDGNKVVILPNGRPWGTKQMADDLMVKLPQEIRENCVVAPDPSDDDRLFKYFVKYSDWVLTVEGGMMHLAFNMGKPFGVILKPGSGPAKWIPYGRTARQIVVENLEEALNKLGDFAQLSADDLDNATITEDLNNNFMNDSAMIYDEVIQDWIKGGEQQAQVTASDGKVFIFRHERDVGWENGHRIDVFLDSRPVGYIHFRVLPDLTGKRAWMARGFDIFPPAIWVNPKFTATVAGRYKEIGRSLMGFAERLAFFEGAKRFYAGDVDQVTFSNFYQKLGFQDSKPNKAYVKDLGPELFSPIAIEVGEPTVEEETVEPTTDQSTILATIDGLQNNVEGDNAMSEQTVKTSPAQSNPIIVLRGDSTNELRIAKNDLVPILESMKRILNEHKNGVGELILWELLRNIERNIPFARDREGATLTAIDSKYELIKVGLLNNDGSVPADVAKVVTSLLQGEIFWEFGIRQGVKLQVEPAVNPNQPNKREPRPISATIDGIRNRVGDFAMTSEMQEWFFEVFVPAFSFLGELATGRQLVGTDLKEFIEDVILPIKPDFRLSFPKLEGAFFDKADVDQFFRDVEQQIFLPNGFTAISERYGISVYEVQKQQEVRGPRGTIKMYFFKHSPELSVPYEGQEVQYKSEKRTNLGSHNGTDIYIFQDAVEATKNEQAKFRALFLDSTERKKLFGNEGAFMSDAQFGNIFRWINMNYYGQLEYKDFEQQRLLPSLYAEEGRHIDLRKYMGEAIGRPFYKARVADVLEAIPFVFRKVEFQNLFKRKLAESNQPALVADAMIEFEGKLATLMESPFAAFEFITMLRSDVSGYNEAFELIRQAVGFFLFKKPQVTGPEWNAYFTKRMTNLEQLSAEIRWAAQMAYKASFYNPAERQQIILDKKSGKKSGSNSAMLSNKDAEEVDPAMEVKAMTGDKAGEAAVTEKETETLDPAKTQIRREIFESEGPLSKEAQDEVRQLFTESMFKQLGWSEENVAHIATDEVRGRNPDVINLYRIPLSSISVKASNPELGQFEFGLTAEGDTLKIGTGSFTFFPEPFADNVSDAIKNLPSHRKLFWWIEDCVKPFAKRLGFKEVAINIQTDIADHYLISLGYKKDSSSSLKRWIISVDPAMLDNADLVQPWLEAVEEGRDVGGIDFTADKTPLEIQNSGSEIKLTIDPAMLKELQNAPGFVPVIINIQPLPNLPLFLGVNQGQLDQEFALAS